MVRTLYEIAGAVGTPLLIDNVTRNRLYGHYARILVDLDLSKKVFYEVLVEREGFAFPVDIEYEGLPDFCTHYHNIGHSINSCRRLHPRSTEAHEQPTNVGKKNIGNRKQPLHSHTPKQNWEPKENLEGIGSSRAFAAIQQDASIPEKVLVDKDVAVAAPQLITGTDPHELEVTEYTDGRSIDLKLLDNDGTVPAQQHVANHNLADTQNSNTMDTTIEMTDKVLEKGMAHDTTQTTMPQNPEHEELGATFTLEAHADVTTNRTDRLPITSTHVLEEIAANENIDGNAAASDDTTTVAVQTVAHSNKNVQNDLDLWARIREYDQRMAEEGFTQVLSKSQKQSLKKQVLSKPYQTRAKGGPPPTSQ